MDLAAGALIASLEWEGWNLVNENRTGGLHWAARRKAVRPRMETPTGGYTPECAYVQAPHPRRVVVVTRVGRRLMDEDNLAASVKPVLDRIKCFEVYDTVVSNMIYDDSPEYCKLIVRQEKGSPAVIVDVYEGKL